MGVSPADITNLTKAITESTRVQKDMLRVFQAMNINMTALAKAAQQKEN